MTVLFYIQRKLQPQRQHDAHANLLPGPLPSSLTILASAREIATMAIQKCWM